jgi:hypothetical protein
VRNLRQGDTVFVPETGSGDMPHQIGSFSLVGPGAHEQRGLVGIAA